MGHWNRQVDHHFDFGIGQQLFGGAGASDAVLLSLRLRAISRMGNFFVALK
jgi:hypothetical protein